MSTPLEGSLHIGRIYDVRDGKFANSDALEPGDTKQLFDFGDAESVTQIGEIIYTYPAAFLFQNMAEAESQTTEQYTMQELYTSSRVKLNVAGSYGAFSSELKASFSTEYLTNNSFYAFFENRLYQLYALSLNQSTTESSFYDILKKDVKDALEKVTDDSSADAFIANYGTHYLHKGIYGGRWQYSEAMATEYFESETTAKAKFSANYMTYSGSIKGEYEVDEIQDSSQSNALFYVRGGDASTLSSDFPAWSATIKEQGNHVLCNFDDSCLQPVSVLSPDAGKQGLLEAAIQRYLTYEVDLQQVDWNGAQSEDVLINNAGDETWISLDDSTKKLNGKEVITGMALKSGSSNMKRSAVKVKNLETGWEYWYENVENNDSNPDHNNDPNVISTTINRADYEQIIELDEGCIATGLGVRVGQGKVKMLKLYYQKIDPANTEGEGSLTHEVHCKASGEDGNHYFEYYPVNGNKSVLIGAGFRVSSDDNGKLKGFKARIVELSSDILKVYTDGTSATA